MNKKKLTTHYMQQLEKHFRTNGLLSLGMERQCDRGRIKHQLTIMN